jgi:hypothetical protein
MGNDMNFSIDIETLDTAPSAVILSVAIVAWDPNVSIEGQGCFKTSFNELVVNMSPVYQIHHGRTMSESTLDFWAEQPEDAWKNANHCCIRDYQDVTEQIVDFVDRFNGMSQFWARGNMDETVLNHLFKECGMDPPWRFFQWRDARSFCDMTRALIEVPSSPLRNELNFLAHTALDDAKNMTLDILETMNAIKKT